MSEHQSDPLHRPPKGSARLAAGAATFFTEVVAESPERLILTNFHETASVKLKHKIPHVKSAVSSAFKLIILSAGSALCSILPAKSGPGEGGRR